MWRAKPLWAFWWLKRFARRNWPRGSIGKNDQPHTQACLCKPTGWANGITTISTCWQMAPWSAEFSRPTRRRSGRRGCGHWPSGIMKIAAQRTAMQRRAKRPWLHSQRVGGGSEDARNAPLNRFHSDLISLRQMSVSRTCLDNWQDPPPAWERDARVRQDDSSIAGAPMFEFTVGFLEVLRT